MNKSRVRETFLNGQDSNGKEGGGERERQSAFDHDTASCCVQGFYGQPFIDYIVNTHLNHLLCSGETPSWDEYLVVEAEIFDVLQERDMYSPMLSIAAYLKMRNWSFYDAGSWVPEAQFDFINRERQFWDELALRRRRQ